MSDLFQPPPGFAPDPRPLVLASSSPRRAELLARWGYRFAVLEPDPTAECGICSRETPPEMVARLAYQKGANVAEKLEAGLVVACDTVAECLGVVLGKPDNRSHAREMLERLRGRDHRVYSGLCVWDRTSAQRSVRVDVSTLRMQPIDDAAIERYLDSEEWEGKAGAFGFQDGPAWIQLLEGSPTNVVGLPMELLASTLASFSTPPFPASNAPGGVR